jgi:sulfatase modifying factor 1
VKRPSIITPITPTGCAFWLYSLSVISFPPYSNFISMVTGQVSKRNKRRREDVLMLEHRPKRGLLALGLTAAAVVLGLSGWALYSNHDSKSGQVVAGTNPAAGMSKTVFQPTVTNRSDAPGKVHEGMIWIPGGEFSMGANDPPDMDEVGMKATPDGRPIHRVYVDGFFMNKTDVTNGEFAKFVKATGYVTVAERKPRAEDFPNAPPENLVAGSVVFAPPDHPVSLIDHLLWWS